MVSILEGMSCKAGRLFRPDLNYAIQWDCSASRTNVLEGAASDSNVYETTPPGWNLFEAN